MLEKIAKEIAKAREDLNNNTYQSWYNPNNHILVNQRKRLETSLRKLKIKYALLF